MGKRRRRYLIVTVVFGAALALLAGCGSGSKSNATTDSDAQGVDGGMEDQSSGDLSGADTSQLDATTPDTLGADGSVDDSVGLDAATEDTLLGDGSLDDTSEPDGSLQDTQPQDTAASDTLGDDGALGDTAGLDTAGLDATSDDATSEDTTSEDGGDLLSDQELDTFVPPPPNNSCDGTPVDVSAGGSFLATFAGATNTQGIECSLNSKAADLIYTFTIDEKKDVKIALSHVDGSGLVAYSVRKQCDQPGSAVRCELGEPAGSTIHELEAGTYFIVVAAVLEVQQLTLEISFLAPTAPAVGDLCSNAIPISTDGQVQNNTLADKANDLVGGCALGYRDVVYTFTLQEAADVTVKLDAGGVGSVSLRSSCADVNTELRCASDQPTFLKVRNLAKGVYYVVVEGAQPQSFSLSVLAVPPVIPTVVSGNDNCQNAYVIPETGGVYTGDTTGLTPTYAASCGNSAASRDAAFRLDLTAKHRVVISTADSEYNTVLHVHKGLCTSGGDFACNDNANGNATSLLDLQLDPGTYFIIVDGFGASSNGVYFLEVLVDPDVLGQGAAS